MNKIKMLGIGLGTTLGSLALGISSTFAASDPDIINAATTTAETIRDNVIDSVIPALPYAVAAGVFFIVIFAVWRMTKRFASGR